VSEQHKDFDLDEDLFDFGGVAPERESTPSDENLDEIFASFREEERKLQAAPVARATEPERADEQSPRPAPAKAAAPAHEEAPAPRPPRPAAQPASAPRAPEPEHTLAPVPRAARFSRGAVAIALAVTLLNSVLAVVMLRGRAPSHDVRATGDERAPSTLDSAPARPAAHVEALPDPESVPATHDHPALDEARTALARGDFAVARQRVYSLLAIVDRLEDPRKSELEAECQYLIAQALHLEALARMGEHE